MNKSTYVYKDPLENGYERVYITRKQHNTLFPYRQISLMEMYEYYWNGETIILQKLYTKWGIIITTLMFPIVMIFGGLYNTKEILEEYKKIFNQKKLGAFSSDSISKKATVYPKIIEIINKKK